MNRRIFRFENKWKAALPSHLLLCWLFSSSFSVCGIRFPRGPIVRPDGAATRWKINGRAGWWVKLALHLPTQTQFLRKELQPRQPHNHHHWRDAKKRQRIDDFLHPFQVPSDFLFPIFFLFFFFPKIFPLVCIILRSEKKIVAFTPWLISRWPGHPEVLSQGNKKKTTKSAPNVKWGRNKKKRNEKKNSNKSRNSSFAPRTRAPSFHEGEKRYE